MTTSTDILYIETDIPAGMLVSDWRRARPHTSRRHVFRPFFGKRQPTDGGLGHSASIERVRPL